MKREKNKMMKINAPYTISSAANALNLHPRTLRNYEKAGLVKPVRRGSWRYYSKVDIAWIKCLHNMIHEKGINITSLSKLLSFAPCWEVADCSAETRAECPVYQNRIYGAAKGRVN